MEKRRLMETVEAISQLRIFWVGQHLTQQQVAPDDLLQVIDRKSLEEITNEQLTDPPDAVVVSLARITVMLLRSIEDFCGKLPYLPLIILVHEQELQYSLEAIRSGAQDVLLSKGVDALLLQSAILMGVERHRLREKLDRARLLEQYLAYHDVLTGLPGRRLLRDRLSQVLGDVVREGKKAAILSLDIDDFKRINDTLGYQSGDKLLKIVGQRLATCIRSSDTLARPGADEFTVLLGRIQRSRDAGVVARKILNSLSLPAVVEGRELFLTGSIGISLVPDDGKEPDELLNRAEIALHRVKAARRNDFRFYNQSMNADAEERLALENSLRKAVEENQMVLHYQPLMDLRTASITSLEALVRWQHPVKGMISPALFIPLAEEIGIIDRIGEWVLETACRQNKMLLDGGLPPVRVAVNFSTHQFHRRSLIKQIDRALKTTGLPASALGIEITESNAMQDVEYSIAELKQLKEIGVQVAIDDFGTGYSSLSYLQQLPIDLLKVDQSFIRGVPDDHSSRSITSAIIFLAHNLELGVVAEGVETPGQMSYLKSLRCDKVQGYHLSRPLAYEQLVQFLANFK